MKLEKLITEAKEKIAKGNPAKDSSGYEKGPDTKVNYPDGEKAKSKPAKDEMSTRVQKDIDKIIKSHVSSAKWDGKTLTWSCKIDVTATPRTRLTGMDWFEKPQKLIDLENDIRAQYHNFIGKVVWTAEGDVTIPLKNVVLTEGVEGGKYKEVDDALLDEELAPQAGKSQVPTITMDESLMTTVTNMDQAKVLRMIQTAGEPTTLEKAKSTLQIDLEDAKVDFDPYDYQAAVKALDKAFNQFTRLVAGKKGKFYQWSATDADVNISFLEELREDFDLKYDKESSFGRGGGDKAQAIWNEKDVNKAKAMFSSMIQGSRINAASKQKMLQQLDTIKTKAKLDYYVANAILKYEGLGLHEQAPVTAPPTPQKKTPPTAPAFTKDIVGKQFRHVQTGMVVTVTNWNPTTITVKILEPGTAPGSGALVGTVKTLGSQNFQSAWKPADSQDATFN